jgi:hypothetical protein
LRGRLERATQAVMTKHRPRTRLDFASIALLVALGAPAIAGCGDDAGSGSSGQGGQGGDCGTAADPRALEVRDAQPAPGSTVPGTDVVHSFTVVDAPGVFASFSFAFGAENTAGLPDPSSFQFIVTQEGADLRYVAEPVTFPMAPGHVEFSVEQVYQTADGCHHAFPDPLFSYDAEAGGTGGAGGSGGTGGAGGG